jgi:pimeloyl-ACP methyl ester carboxylesterase
MVAKKSNKIRVLLLMPVSFLILLLFIRTSDLLHIKHFVFPGSSNKALPSIKNGQLLQFKGNKDTVFGFFSYNSAGKKLMVLFHGNSQSIHDFGEIGNYYYHKGYSILIPEYPGYGIASAFTASESAIYSDCSQAIQFITASYSIKTENTFFVGYSLGTGIACEMARRNLCGKMVLLAPYTSISEVLEYRTVPFFPKLLVVDDFNTQSKANKIKCKVLLVHGKSDRKIPFSMSEDLNKRFTNSQLLLVDGAGHDILSCSMGPSVVANKIKTFLDEK